MTPKGAKTWVSMYRHEGTSRMITHGRYPEITAARANALHGRALTRAMSRAQDIFEFEEPFTVHDLRRTLRTGLVRVRDQRGHPIPREVKEHILNHKPRDPLDDAYDQHDYMDDMREALEQ